MGRSVKILLSGFSGSGKTTALGLLCGINTFLVNEEMRKPREEELEAWKVATDFDDFSYDNIPTSRFPNFGHCVMSYLPSKAEYILFKRHDGVMKDNEVLVNIFDTVGQDGYYQLRKVSSEGADGIMFFIDTTLLPFVHSKKVIELFNELNEFYDNNIPPLIFVCNKYDLVRKYEKKNRSKVEIFKMSLRVNDSRFRDYRFFDASALEGWGIVKGLSYLLKKIMRGI